jgi:hypothetical protein
MVVVVALGLLVVGCSSSKSDSSSPSSSSSTLGPASQAGSQICNDLKEVQSVFNTTIAGVRSAGGGEGLATAMQSLLQEVQPKLEAAQASAPDDIKPALQTLNDAYATAAQADPSTSAGQAELQGMLLSPDASVSQAGQDLATWASTNCGIAFDVG